MRGQRIIQIRHQSLPFAALIPCDRFPSVNIIATILALPMQLIKDSALNVENEYHKM